MLKLLFTGETDAPLDEKDFAQLLREAEVHLPVIPEEEVELVLLDDPAMQTLNRETRGLDKPTDVLSFSNREERGSDVSTFPCASLGQIFISVPAARRNADEMSQSLKEELRFLFIHGLLHILGYDHQTPDEEFEMMSLAYRILGRPPYKR